MEQAQKKAFTGVLIWVLAGIGVLVVVGWLVLYAPWWANTRGVISYRSEYFNKIGMLLPERPVYTLRPVAVDADGEYTYQLAGQVASVDYAKQVLMIRDMWGRQWRVQFETVPMAGISTLKRLVINQRVMGSVQPGVRQTASIVIDPNAPEQTKGFEIDEMVVVRWQDTRKIGEIGREITLSHEKVVPILRIVDGGKR